MRNFFMTFFFRERARTKNRSIRWLLPLSSWGRGWQLVGKKLYILKHVQLYIHTLLFIQSQIHPFRTQTISPFLLWYFQWLVLNFQTGRLKIIVMCILQNFKRNFGSGQTATHSICSLFWRRSTMLFVMLNFPILVLPHVISIVWLEKKWIESIYFLCKPFHRKTSWKVVHALAINFEWRECNIFLIRL